MIKYIALFSLLAAVVVSSSVHAIDRDVEIEIRRLDQRMIGLEDRIGQMLKDIRALQRAIDKMEKPLGQLSRKQEELIDSVVKLQNIDISNLKAGQKSLYDQIPVLNWGADTRACEDLKAVHQQVETVKSKDGVETVKFLCYDGKALHLETEVSVPPKR